MSETVCAVVPTYNSADSLPNAIESIRNQNWPGLEIIVVDDGSTDDTAAVLRKLGAGDLRVIRQKNGGPGAARNRALEITAAEWVAFLDADDIWLPHKLEMQMDCLRSERSHGFCYADSLRRTISGTESVRRAPGLAKGAFRSLLLGPRFDLSTVVVRRDCFAQVGLFDPELRTGEDWDLWLRLSALCHGCYVPKPLSVYRVPSDPDKYPLPMYERCQVRILGRLFSNQNIARVWPKLAQCRGQVYAWHYATLAKSFLHGRRLPGFLRLAVASVSSHPMGIYFLARRWSSLEGWPTFDLLEDDGARS